MLVEVVNIAEVLKRGQLTSLSSLLYVYTFVYFYFIA